MTNILNKLKELFYGPPVEPEDCGIKGTGWLVVTHKPKFSVKGKRKKSTRAKKVKKVKSVDTAMYTSPVLTRRMSGYDEVVGRR